MQSLFPKIAAVLLTICSVAFMGMSIAAFFGRPDPISEMHSPETSEYVFTAALPPENSWTVTPSVGEDKNPRQHPTAYPALLDALNHKAGRSESAAKEMNEVTTQVRETVTRVRAEQQEDSQALQNAIDRLRQLAEAEDAQLMQRSQELQKLAVDTTDVRNETTKRREDVIRLQNELEELKTDRFRLEELQRILTDRLLRLQLENESLQIRSRQLASDTGSNNNS
ncbi:MAG: hypothetical protein KDA81_03130 [Planctomycetaceae bacterium]|nr:hypothetical protein [Planctomycetaceae bacterium]